MTIELAARQKLNQEVHKLMDLDCDIFEFFLTFFRTFRTEVELKVVSNIMRVKNFDPRQPIPKDKAEFKKLPAAKVGPIQMFEFADNPTPPAGTKSETVFYPYKWCFDGHHTLASGKICFRQLGANHDHILQYVAVEPDDIQLIQIRMIPINPFPEAQLNNDARALIIHRPGSDRVVMSGRSWDREWMTTRLKDLINEINEK